MSKFKKIIISTLFTILFLSGIASLLFASVKTKQTHQVLNHSNKESSAPIYYFVQTAKKGTLQIDDEKTGTYKLVLNDVNPKVTYISDRPNRISGQISIEKFLNNWRTNKAADNFAIDPPNAALSATLKGKKNTVYSVQLKNPIYDNEKQTLTYTLQFDSEKSAQIQKENILKNISLFIDSSWCPSCCCG